jgi:hypothetical protein
LVPADKALVDQGLLREGMDTQMVRMSWGRPGAIHRLEPVEKKRVEWTYEGLRWVDMPTWYYYYNSYGMPGLDYRTDRTGVPYTRAKVLFENDRVIAWQTFQ